MLHEIVIPQVGEAVAEVILVQWFKRAGDAVCKGEPLFELDTDKVTLDVEAFADGTLAEIHVADGAAVMPQQVVGLLAVKEAATSGGQAGQTVQSPTAEVVAEAKITPVAQRLASDLNLNTDAFTGTGPGGRITANDVRGFAGQQRQRATTVNGSGQRDGRILASPKARRIAQERHVDLTTLTGTGVDGLIRAADVEAVAEGIQPALASETILPVSRMRQAIGANTLKSKQSAPHFYLLADVEMSGVQGLRRYCVDTLGWTKSPTYTDIIVRACGLALAATPELNVHLTEQGLQLRERVDIGVAISVEGGLLTPVLTGVDRLSLAATSQRLIDLTERSRTGRLRPDDLSAKSMVVSNLGMYAVDAFIAIIDLPDPMVLAVGRVSDRVVAVAGQPVVRPLCTLTLSADHRVLDGVAAAQFLTHVVQILEQPFEILGFATDEKK